MLQLPLIPLLLGGIHLLHLLPGGLPLLLGGLAAAADANFCLGKNAESSCYSELASLLLTKYKKNETLVMPMHVITSTNSNIYKCS